MVGIGQGAHVTLSGLPGAGKSSVARALGARGFAVVSAGDVFRAEAAARGMDVVRLGEAMLSDRALADEVNHAVDARVVAAAASPGRVVIDARTAFARDPGAIKVYVDCPVEERARRAALGARPSEDYDGSIRAATEGLRSRDAFEAAEMGRLTGTDVSDMRLYDFVADSLCYSPGEIAGCISEVALAMEAAPTAPSWVALATATASHDVPDALGVAHDVVCHEDSPIPVGSRLDVVGVAEAAARGPWLGSSDLLVYYPANGTLASCVYYDGEGFSTWVASAAPGRLGEYEPIDDTGVYWGYPNAAACLASEGPSGDAIVLASGRIRLPDGRGEAIPELDGSPIGEDALESLEDTLSDALGRVDRY